MRVLLSLEGAAFGTTRKALARVPHDAVHVLAVEPESEEIETVRDLVERQGARFSVEKVGDASLLDAFATIQQAIRTQRARFRDEAGQAGKASTVHVQINAGKDANLLSAAGLLACLHEGAPAHFVHEAGHTPLPVFTEAPLERLLGEDERIALIGFPGEGIPLAEASEHDPAALSGLKDRGLIERVDERLVLTDQGASYQAHVRKAESGAGEG